MLELQGGGAFVFNPNKIEDLQFSTEKQIMDRKSARIRAVDLAIPIVAMANADGGFIVIGIEDNGTITGIDDYEKNLLKKDDVISVVFKGGNIFVSTFVKPIGNPPEKGLYRNGIKERGVLLIALRDYFFIDNLVGNVSIREVSLQEGIQLRVLSFGHDEDFPDEGGEAVDRGNAPVYFSAGIIPGGTTDRLVFRIPAGVACFQLPEFGIAPVHPGDHCVHLL